MGDDSAVRGKRTAHLVAVLHSSMPPKRPNAALAPYFFFQAEDGIRDPLVTEFRRVLFRSTTALGLALALSKRAGKTLPWPTVGGAIDGALRAGLLELTVDSGAWPCGYGAAQTVRLRLKSGIEIPPSPPPPPAGQLSAEADLSPAQIQDLADVIGDIASVAVGHQWGLRVHFELGGEQRPPVEVVNKVSEILRGISKDLDLA